MLCCPHCHAKAQILPILQSSHRKPFQCVDCEGFSELPFAHRVISTALFTLCAFSLFFTKTLALATGADWAHLLIVLFLVAAILYLKFLSRLTPLTDEEARQRSTLKISWILGGRVTPFKWVVAIVTVWIVGIALVFFYHVPVLNALLWLAGWTTLMAAIGWMRFRTDD
jgi:hypothetical protein